MFKLFLISVIYVVIGFVYSQQSVNGNDNYDDDQLGDECEMGECVQHYLCISNNTFNKYGSGIIDDRFGGSDPNEPKRCSYLETCCNGNITEPNKVLPDVHSFKFQGCGHRIRNGTVITNIGNTDNYTQYGELPWTILITRKELLIGLETYVLVAAGSLIHPKVVMTTSHNILKDIDKKLIVRAGEWDTATTQEPYPHVESNVAEIIMHEHFYKPANLNDIALLILEKAFELTFHIQTACLPPPDYNFDGETKCIATGWGKHNFGKLGVYQTILKKIIVPMIDKEECEMKFRTTRLSQHFQLHDSLICAGGNPGIDTCTGDGGAPLVCPIHSSAMDRYYQAGIVSWGIGCLNDIPGAYVNVAKFRKWIDKQFEIRNLETSYYNYIN